MNIDETNDTSIQETEQHDQETSESSVSSDKERNFRALRERADAVAREKERLQQERDAYYKQLQDIQSRQQDSQESSLSPDDLVEWKHVQKELSKVKDELNAYKSQSQAQSAETRLRMQYPDFDTVVNSYNIDRLRSEYPELASSINANSDIYSKAVSAYTLIKKLNIMPSDEELKTHARIQENTSKPKPSSTLSPQQGDSPLQRANVFAQGLTPELRAQLLKEMQDAKKRL